MFDLIKKYPIAAAVSGLLHVMLFVWMGLNLTNERSPVGQSQADSVTVKGVIVTEEDIQSEIDRIQRAEEERQSKLIEEREEREETLRKIEESFSEAELKLQETELLTEQQQAQVEEEKARLEACLLYTSDAADE